MARCKSKPVQKRRRIGEQQARAQAQAQAQEAAVAILRKAPKDVVEAAATEAFRSKVAKWERLDGAALRADGGVISSSTGKELADGGRGGSPPSVPVSLLPAEFCGLGRCPIEDEADFDIIQRLHDAIKEKSQHWTSWSGAKDDPRRRAFGFLPGTLGCDEAVRSILDVSMPNASEDAAAEERPRNAQAAVILGEDDVPAGFDGAINRLLEKLRPSAPPRLRRYFCVDQLVAAQPNLHSGQHILPPHVDHPTKDGFGVVIVTVAIRGGATITVETWDRRRQAAFELPPRYAYVLSGPVRDACVHGVLADEGTDGANRESLNLRLGLHEQTDDDPPASDVLRHWRDVG